jgi:hypothetical protein
MLFAEEATGTADAAPPSVRTSSLPHEAVSCRRGDQTADAAPPSRARTSPPASIAGLFISLAEGDSRPVACRLSLDTPPALINKLVCSLLLAEEAMTVDVSLSCSTSSSVPLLAEEATGRDAFLLDFIFVP